MDTVLVWRRSPSSPLPANSKIAKEDTRRLSATPRLESGSSDERQSRGRSGKSKREQKQRNDEEIEDDSKNGSASHTVPRSRVTRAWKVVDAKTILTKRKYVRKVFKEMKDDARYVAMEDDFPKSNSQESLHEELARFRRSSPEGGVLQGVPFEYFSHGFDPSVREALDYLVHDIGSVSMPGVLHANGFSPKVHAYVKLSFDHSIFFHAMVAFAQGYKEVARTGATEPSAVVLYHRGKATEALCTRLKDPLTRADDISILTAFLLVDNVWRYGENEIGRQHYAGLLKMIEMRGGLDQLGICGILKAMIDFAAVTDLGDSLRSPISTALPDLQYHTHPFSASVCSIISKLPQGYGEIALSGQLSVQTITTITSLNEWLHTDPAIRSPAPHQQIGAARRCLSASKSPAEGNIEQAVCLGVWITSMRTFHARFSRMDKDILDRIVKVCQDFNKKNHRPSASKTAEREHLAYLTIVAVEASEKCLELQSHVNILVELLTKREKCAMGWAGMENVIKKFFLVPFAIENWRECWLRQLKRLAEAQSIAATRALSQRQSREMWKDIVKTSLDDIYGDLGEQEGVESFLM